MTLDEEAVTTANQALRYLHRLLGDYDRVTTSKEFAGVFTLAHIHGMPYTGPQFDLTLLRETRLFLEKHKDYLEIQGPA